MKKTLLALAVLAAASSVNAAEIYKSDEASVGFYGQLRTELLFLEDKDAKLDSGSSRMGVDAAYAINDSVKVHGLVELSVRHTYSSKDKDGTGKNDLYIRKHLLGFSGDFGKVTLGKDYTTADDVWGAEYSYIFGGDSIAYATDAHDSQIKYVFENEAFWLKAGYGFDEDDANKQLMEAFVGSNFGDLAFHVGGGKSEQGAEDITFYEATAEYTIDKFLLGATYYAKETEVGTAETDTTGISVGINYKWADNATAYLQHELIETDPKGAASTDVNSTILGTDYHLNKWSRVYTEIQFKDEDNKDNETNYGVGVRVYW